MKEFDKQPSNGSFNREISTTYSDTSTLPEKMELRPLKRDASKKTFLIEGPLCRSKEPYTISELMFKNFRWGNTY